MKTNWLKAVKEPYVKTHLAGTVLIYFAKPGNLSGVSVNNKRIAWNTNNFRYINKSDYMILGNLYNPKENTFFRVMSTVATLQESTEIMIGTESNVLITGKPQLLRKNNVLFKVTKTNEVHDVDDTITSIHNEQEQYFKRKWEPSSPDDYYWNPSPMASLTYATLSDSESVGDQFGYQQDDLPERYSEEPYSDYK